MSKRQPYTVSIVKGVMLGTSAKLHLIRQVKSIH